MQEVRLKASKAEEETNLGGIRMCRKTLFELFANLGDWLTKEAKNRDNAIILGVLSILSPIGFIFAISFIMSVYRKRKK